MVKKIMNGPQTTVDEMLEGMVCTYPELKVLEGFRTVVRKKLVKGKVGVMTMGGSGHEPAHAGYIGNGLLDAAVAGNLFASPSPDQILKSIETVNTGAGVLVVLKNYSGDLMNYSIAREFAEAEGISVECVVVKDDVAVPDSTYSTGRRGIAGTVFVHKIAGARAAEGAELKEVKAAAEKAAGAIRTMGMSMTACTLPGLDKPGFNLADDEIEIGMGIHGEPGIQRTTVKTSKELAEILLRHIMEDYDYSKKKAAVLINGLGATPLMELYVLTKDVKKRLDEYQVEVHKIMTGNYMTSLEMAGCSVTLFELDDDLCRLFDAPCQSPAWHQG